MATQTLELEVLELRNEVARLKRGPSSGLASPGGKLSHNGALARRDAAEVQSLKQKVQRLEDAVADAAVAVANEPALKRQLAEWEECSTLVSGVSGPHNLRGWLAQKQQEELVLHEALSKAQRAAADAEARASQLQTQNVHGTERAGDVTRESQQLADRLRHAEAQLRQRTEECGRLESALMSSSTPATSSEDLMQLRSQVARLEAQLSSEQDAVRVKSVALAEQCAETREFRSSKEELEVRLTKMEADKKRLLEQVETLDAQVVRLESSVDSGTAYNPKRTKIVHMSMNPESETLCETVQDRTQLRAEITHLRERNKELLLLLGNSGVSSSAAAPEAMQALQEEVLAGKATVNATVEQLEKEKLKNLRLLEVFKKKIHEFREACCQLTGYRIDMLQSSTNQYRLTSMYAMKEGDYFMFQKDADGDMQLLETDVCSQWEKEIGTFLSMCKSIPAFLSHVSLQMFQSKTVM